MCLNCLGKPHLKTENWGPSSISRNSSDKKSGLEDGLRIKNPRRRNSIGISLGV